MVHPPKATTALSTPIFNSSPQFVRRSLTIRHACIRVAISPRRHDPRSPIPRVPKAWPTGPCQTGPDWLTRELSLKSNDPAERVSAWDPQTFYDSVHVPPADLPLWPQLEGRAPAGFLDCTLYPFQKRTVQFMVEREGARLIDGEICSPPNALPGTDGTDPTVLGAQYFRGDGPGENRRGRLRSSRPPTGGPQRPRTTRSLLSTAEPAAPHRTSGATLIITPTHLLQQWKDEFALHAPNMRVLHYQGIKRRRASTSAANSEHCDVVLTTYSVIAGEIW